MDGKRISNAFVKNKTKQSKNNQNVQGWSDYTSTQSHSSQIGHVVIHASSCINRNGANGYEVLLSKHVRGDRNLPLINKDVELKTSVAIHY